MDILDEFLKVVFIADIALIEDILIRRADHLIDISVELVFGDIIGALLESFESFHLGGPVDRRKSTLASWCGSTRLGYRAAMGNGALRTSRQRKRVVVRCRLSELVECGELCMGLERHVILVDKSSHALNGLDRGYSTCTGLRSA